MTTVAIRDAGQSYATAPLRERQDYAMQLAMARQLLPSRLQAASQEETAGRFMLLSEMGAMLGVHPLAAVNGVNIIDGTPTIAPGLMSGLVRAAGHKLRIRATGSVARGDYAVTVTLVRSDDPDYPFESTWNAERAQRAGLANKSNWKNYFEAMCKARAISEVCREGAEDVLMGVRYTPDEVGAEVDSEGNLVPEQLGQMNQAQTAHRYEPAEQQAPPPQQRQQTAQTDIAEPVATRDWFAEISAKSTAAEVSALWYEARELGELGLPVADGSTETVDACIKRVGQDLAAQVEDAVVVEEEPAVQQVSDFAPGDADIQEAPAEEPAPEGEGVDES